MSAHSTPAPSPTKPPFVKVGDKVNEGDTVCIVESMKVMTEIQADISGTVKSIAVKDGEAVDSVSRSFNNRITEDCTYVAYE